MPCSTLALNCIETQIRLLFAIVLTTCCPARAQILWDSHEDSMTASLISFSDAMYNEALIAIEDLCIAIANLPINQFGMSSPNRSASDLLNTDMNCELKYDTAEMASIVSRNAPLLNDEKKLFTTAVLAGQGGFFFLDAAGGTVKTFLFSLLVAEIRSKNDIVLAVASSGIAATLLDGTHKHSLEALDGTLKDIKNNDKLFGGTLFLLSGNFRQTLSVIPRSMYADEINACLKSL